MPSKTRSRTPRKHTPEAVQNRLHGPLSSNPFRPYPLDFSPLDGLPSAIQFAHHDTPRILLLGLIRSIYQDTIAAGMPAEQATVAILATMSNLARTTRQAADRWARL